MASIKELIEDVSNKLDEANFTDNDRKSAGHVLIALSTLLEVVRRQEEREQRIAQALDELADKISFLSTSPREVCEQICGIARLIRAAELPPADEQ